MKLKELMTTRVECVRQNDTLQIAARKMKDLSLGLMPVCDERGRVVGMLTDRDLAVRAAATGMDPVTTAVSDVMTDDVIWCFEDQESADAMELMEEYEVRRLIVMDRDKHLAGIVSQNDLARAADTIEVIEPTLAIPEFTKALAS
ncbi:CBS domain-containing protein [Singulisphaera sp. PoT]|uniref:CBS domain-containing protein n=1 Tax=Singulisphaera sp. PoT TaxID=3411797 RepID=UPI003BF5EA13